MNDREAIKVLIVNENGLYLAGTAFQWEFTDDRRKARVFDYHADHVADRIDLLRKAEGQVLIAVRVDPREIYEFCDQCGCRTRALKMFFDGQQFLCSDCRTAGSGI
ncbi:MAG TPA: hypothetical protein P5205_08005 [Candidatus Paceibacterota bacterium]|nr:hypothetical protein [Verrucomicrobiota bacterium]HSA10302.1 hypothetical protein [Candidatus Paceibacterota bacterium]